MSDFQQILVFAILFGVVSLIETNRTYLILFLAALANLVIYPFADVYSAELEARLDLIVLLAVLVLGNRHVKFQVGLLLFALLMHNKFELDQANGTDLIFSNYGGVIIGITIMQLSGVFHGFLKRIWKSNYYRGVHFNSANLNRIKVWPEK